MAQKRKPRAAGHCFSKHTDIGDLNSYADDFLNRTALLHYLQTKLLPSMCAMSLICPLIGTY